MIRAGSTLLDLQDIKVWEFEKAQGWLTFILPVVLGRTVRANFFQVVIQANTLGGRDSRVRQIKVFGPLEYVIISIFKNIVYYINDIIT